MAVRAGRRRIPVHRPAAGRDAHQGGLGRPPTTDHLTRRTHGPAAESQDLIHRHRVVSSARGADGHRPGPHHLPRAGRDPLSRAAAAGTSTGGGGHRPVVHLRPSRSARPDVRSLRDPDRLLHHRGDHGADLRGHALPRGEPRGGAAFHGAALRSSSRHPRGQAHDSASKSDPPDGAARGGLRRGPLLRPGAR